MSCMYSSEFKPSRHLLNILSYVINQFTVPLFYDVVEAVILGAYCIIAWKCGWTKVPKDENFCVTIAKTYEVEEEEDPTLERLIYEEATEETKIVKEDADIA